MNSISYNEAKNHLISGNYSVENYFIQNNFILEYGYCQFMSGDISAASNAFSKILDIDFRANWANKLIQIINNSIIETPSFFQIRNFLEIDLNLLLEAGQAEFIEIIINRADLLSSINPESYKFISRVMLNNDFYDVALFYLNKAKNNFYCDPEMHFMLANCYIKKGDNQAAKDSVNNCLRILPEYYPAKKLLLTLS